MIKERTKDEMQNLFTVVCTIVPEYTIQEISNMVSEVEDDISKGYITHVDKFTKEQEIDVFLDHFNCENTMQLVNGFEQNLEGKIKKDTLIKLVNGDLVDEEIEVCEEIINILGFERALNLIEINQKISEFNSISK